MRISLMHGMFTLRMTIPPPCRRVLRPVRRDPPAWNQIRQGLSSRSRVGGVVAMAEICKALLIARLAGRSKTGRAHRQLLVVALLLRHEAGRRRHEADRRRHEAGRRRRGAVRVEVVDPFRGRAHRHLVCRRREVLVAFPLHRETGRRREVVVDAILLLRLRTGVEVGGCRRREEGRRREVVVDAIPLLLLRTGVEAGGCRRREEGRRREAAAAVAAADAIPLRLRSEGGADGCRRRRGLVVDACLRRATVARSRCPFRFPS